MNELLQSIANFAAGTGFWVYAFIFFGKLMEVSIGTLRIVVINRGIRTVGALMAFAEIVLWLVVASTVLTGFREDWLKALFYAIAYALGNFLGSLLDERLALGLCSVQAIVPNAADVERLCAILRKAGFAVTTMDVRGRDNEHGMLLMNMKRKRSGEAIALIEKELPDAVITISDVKTQRRGYLPGSTRPALQRHSYRRIGK